MRRSALLLVLVSSLSSAGVDDGTIPKLDFPAVATTAKQGDWVLSLNKLELDRLVSDPAKQGVVLYSYKVLEPGAKASKLDDMGKPVTVPNSLVIAIPKGQQAKVGDIVLTWWQTGSGMERAIVTDAKDPKQPTVRYLDIAYDNPAKSRDGKVTIGQMDEKLAADSFVGIGKPFEAGTTVACKDGSAYKTAFVIQLAGDKLLATSAAGLVAPHAKADCVALPQKPSVKAGDKLMGDFAGTMHAATVTKVDAKIGRVWVKFDGLGDRETALPFGMVIAKL